MYKCKDGYYQCVGARVCVMTTSKVFTFESNYQLQRECENHWSKFSVLFDTIAVDAAVLKCPIVICQCIVRSYEYRLPLKKNTLCSNYVIECSGYRTASSSSGLIPTALHLVGQTRILRQLRRRGQWKVSGTKGDAINRVVGDCVCCSDLDVHVFYW